MAARLLSIDVDNSNTIYYTNHYNCIEWIHLVDLNDFHERIFDFAAR